MACIKIGWADGEMTPEQPVLIAGQFHARVSEGVADDITMTALALDTGDDHVVMVCCDVVAIPDEVRDAVRARLSDCCEGLDPMKVVLNATHTHTGPEIRTPTSGAGHTSRGTGVDLEAMPVADYVAFAVERIAGVVSRAWASRAEGAVAFGQGYAVIGRNRRWVSTDGVSTMYGNTDAADFGHIEGYEDHSLNVLATRDLEGKLTGLIVNVPCPSQEDEGDYVLSADYWYETRRELRRRFGDEVFVLAQCSVAGDQSPHLIFDKRATARMLELTGRTYRQEIAQRIANAVEETLSSIESTFDSELDLNHHVERLDLPMNAFSERDKEMAMAEAEKLHEQYQAEMQKLEAHPELREQPRWYRAVTQAYRRMKWNQGVVERFEMQADQPTLPVESHVLRLGEMAFATVPFEYYLDFGIYIKARSKAVQTFLVQLAGGGTYVPSKRSVSGGGYGSIPASNPVGPEGGRLLAEKITDILARLWAGDGEG